MMLDNIFSLVFGRTKNKSSSIRHSQHDSTSTTTTSTTTTNGRSTGGSNQISAPFSMPPPPAQAPQVPQTQSQRILPYPPHNTSSTPLSFNNMNSNNTSSLREEHNIYTMPNVSIQRRTPLPVGALDDLSGLSDPFKRTTKARMSLPIIQQNKLRRQSQSYAHTQRINQFPPQSLGHIYLQHNGETKQAFLPNELTSIDTIWALFVCSFPYLLTMEYMSLPHVKVYIYNPNCNIFYELRDIDDVKHESVLRIHQGDPLLALPPHYHQVRFLPQIPPPKPRRMIQAQPMHTGGGWVGI